MRLILLILVFGSSAIASDKPTQGPEYVSGMAPFCLVDNFGNMQCYYYTLQSCYDAMKMQMGAVGCVIR